MPVGNFYGCWQLEPETPHIRYILLRMLRFKSSEDEALSLLIASHARLRGEESQRSVRWRALPRWKRWLARCLGIPI